MCKIDGEIRSFNDFMLLISFGLYIDVNNKLWTFQRRFMFQGTLFGSGRDICVCGGCSANTVCLDSKIHNYSLFLMLPAPY